MTFPSHPPLRLTLFLPPSPYSEGSVPRSPLPYLDIGILFYTGKTNKTKKYAPFFFFFLNVSFSDWLCCLGIWKNRLEVELPCRILKLLLRSQGLHGQGSPLTGNREEKALKLLL